MRLIEANWSPSNRQLRQFGVLAAGMIPIAAWCWGAEWILLAAVCLTCVVGAVLAYAFPLLLKPIFLALMLVTIPIGIVVGELAMLTLYFAVLWPTSLLLKLSRRDPLQLKVDRKKDSYWEPKQKGRGVASYYRQS